MTHKLLAFSFVAALVTLGYYALPPSGAAFDVAQSRIEQRIAVKYCYGQYRGQADVFRCLGRGA
jgi:hypothetical protein